MSSSCRSGWTPERRARQAAAIRAWKPWKNSTGPRTQLGKMRSAMNAMKHGQRRADIRAIANLLRRHRAWLAAVMAHRKYCIFSANELLAASCHLVPADQVSRLRRSLITGSEALLSACSVSDLENPGGKGGGEVVVQALA